MTKPLDAYSDSSTVAISSGDACLIPAKRSWGNPSWELLNELPVDLQVSESETLVAACVIVQEYGIGETFDEAIEDLLTSLSDYYESLEAREDRLAESEANDLAELRQLIRRRAALRA